MRIATRTLTDDPIVLRIMDQLKIQNKSEKSLLKALELPNSMFSAWKFENVKSYWKHIDGIAEYLGVSKEYLLEGIDPDFHTDKLTPTDLKLLKMFHAMGNEQQKCYMKMGRFLVESSEYKKEFEKNEENEV